MDTRDSELASPYIMSQPPTSPGRALLSRAYAHYCALEWGYSDEELAAAFQSADQSLIPSELVNATRLFGELLARGDIRSWARPFGGGEPVVLKSTLWELDDYKARFAASALNLKNPFDCAEACTHWIFVDVDGWNRVVEELLQVDDAVRPSTNSPVAAGDAKADGRARASASVAPEKSERLIRLPEVLTRTGISKSTIYRRMPRGRFPQSLSLDGNIVFWREREIDEWVTKPG